MDPLTAFGAVAVGAMLVFYALELRSSWFVLAFAGACLASSAYGFLQGAWPFGVVELIWSGVAVRRWRSRLNAEPGRMGLEKPYDPALIRGARLRAGRGGRRRS